MESDARPPQKLSNPNNWNRFKKDFEVYMKITNGYEKPEDVQVAWLLNFMGPIGLKALEKIIFNDPEDEKKLTIVIEKLDVFFNPAKNVIEERYKFFSKSKKGNESIDIFILDLLEISKFCNFGEQAENLVRDVVLLNIKEKHLRELLFTENDLNLEKLKVIIKTYEINSKKIEQVSKELMSLQTGSENKTVNSSAPKRPQSASRRPRSTSRKPSFSKNDSSKEFTKGCWKCGRVHPLGRCPAFKAECVYCNRPNHFSHCCPIAKLEGVKVTPKVNDTE